MIVDDELAIIISVILLNNLMKAVWLDVYNE